MKMQRADLKKSRIKAKTDGLSGNKSIYFSSDWQQAIEAEFMLDVAEMVIVSAVKREERRGHHHRSDYPKMDNSNWLVHTAVKLVTRRH